MPKSKHKKEEKKPTQKTTAKLHFNWRARPADIEDVVKMMFPGQDYYQRWALFLIRKARERSWAVEDWPAVVLEYLKENYYYEGLDPYNLEELQALYERYNEQYSATTRNAKLDDEFKARFSSTLRKYYMQYRRVLTTLLAAGILKREEGYIEFSKRFLGWVKALYDAVSNFYLGVEDFEDLL